MRKIFTLFGMAITCLATHAQTVCGTVLENGTLTLTAPPGMVFNSIVFASYGTPGGSCGSFTKSSCDASTSTSVVSSILLNNNSGSIPANNSTFGDPCSGTSKLLAVEAGYTAALPLTLISFSARKVAGGTVALNWVTNDEVNTSDFVIEKSTDGLGFVRVGDIPAKGLRTNNYDFTVAAGSAAVAYYRLKMMDKDGRFTYSKNLRINQDAGLPVSFFPNPAKDAVVISGLTATSEIRLIDLKGTLLKQLTTTAQSLSIDISKFVRGMYVLQVITGKEHFSQKLMVQ